MRISSTRRPPPPPPAAAPSQPHEEKTSLLSQLPLSEAAVELPEALLHLTELQESSRYLGDGIRLGISGMALTRALQAFESEEPGSTLEGISSLGLVVAGGGSVVGGGAGSLVSGLGESVHGLCEIFLGAGEIRDGLEHPTGGFSPDLASGVLGVAKGASTFLPMLFPGTDRAVGLAHVGLITARAVLSHLNGMGHHT